MAEYKRDRGRDAKRRTLENVPTNVDIRQSILEMRRIYSDKTPKEFARWYSKRCKIKESAILALLEREEGKAGK